MQHFSSLLRRGPVAGLLLLLAWLAGPVARAQAPAWQAVITPSQTSSSSSQVRAMTSDANGDIILAGVFTGTVSFGNITLTSAGGQDIFVVKWNPATAAFSWGQRAGGTSDDWAYAVAATSASVYITGVFNSDTAVFGTATLTNNAPGANRGDVFVAKLIDTGTGAGFMWSQRAGGPDNEFALAMVVRGSSVYIGGQFSSATAAFGSQVLTKAGSTLYSDAFVAKLVDAGPTASFAWAQRAGGGDNDRVQSLDVVGTSVYLGGYFTGSSADFGSTVLSSAGQADAFVSKLTDAGSTSTFGWTQQLGGTGFDAVGALLLNGSTLYVAGNFSNVFPVGSTALTAAGGTDAFVAKLSDAGTTPAFGWVKSAGGPGTEGVVALALRNSSLFVAGVFGSPSLSVGSTTLVNNSSNGTNNIFLAKLTDAGGTSNFDWATQHTSPSTGGSVGSNYATAFAVSGTTVYAAGYVSPPASFGSIAVSGPGNNLVGFLASLTDPTLLATTAPNGSLRFSLAPNPARTVAAVQLPAVPGAATAALTLLDALGRPVRAATVPLSTNTSTELDLRGLAPGLYALRVAAGGSTATQRLVVE
jgi:hypothetical protein